MFIKCLTFIISVLSFAAYGYDLSDNVAPSRNPPHGLSPSEVPQFIVLGSDDQSSAEGMEWILDYIESRTNPDGSPVTMVFYSNSRNFSDPQIVQQHLRAVSMGCEIGNHTANHIALELDWTPGGDKVRKQMTLDDWRAEISECQEAIVEVLGLPVESVAGFRTPFLAYNDSTFTVLRELGFLYDCSIIEGTGTQRVGRYYWPYTMNNGSPGHNASWYRQFFDIQVGSHPGLWVLPCYNFVIPSDDESQQYGIEPGLIAELDEMLGYATNGKVTPLDYNLWASRNAGGVELNKEQSLAVLKHTLDKMYNGNRTPMTLGMHTDFYISNYWNPSDFVNIQDYMERRAVIEEFIDYALQLEDVRFVTGIDVINFMRNPPETAVPVSQEYQETEADTETITQ
ncbi:chitin deacetylase [Chitinispirillum alkaliphilum]|nr:chitin deacetylase [Chitinispirillum alkaliphilum]